MHPPQLRERRFCLTLFVSQVCVVLVCALLLYLTLSPHLSPDSEPVFRSNSSVAPGTPDENNESAELDTNTKLTNQSLTTETGTEDADDECMFIPAAKLPHCIRDSWNGIYNATAAFNFSLPASPACNVQLQLTCNGTDVKFEDDEVAASISCDKDFNASSLILRPKGQNGMFNCSIKKDDERGGHCNGTDAEAELCPGVLLSCACLALDSNEAEAPATGTTTNSRDKSSDSEIRITEAPALMANVNATKQFNSSDETEPPPISKRDEKQTQIDSNYDYEYEKI